MTVRSASLDEIGEVFLRVNSQGMRITSADRAIALLGKLDMRAMADELRHKIREDIFALGGIDPILMGFNLITERQSTDGDPPKLEAMASRVSKRIECDEAASKIFANSGTSTRRRSGQPLTTCTSAFPYTMSPTCHRLTYWLPSRCSSITTLASLISIRPPRSASGSGPPE